MINVLLITFIITLLYLAIANRLITYINILAVQGFILFGVTFLQLHEINTVNLVLILLETVVFKALAVPIPTLNTQAASLTQKFRRAAHTSHSSLVRQRLR